MQSPAQLLRLGAKFLEETLELTQNRARVFLKNQTAEVSRMRFPRR